MTARVVYPLGGVTASSVGNDADLRLFHLMRVWLNARGDGPGAAKVEEFEG